MRNIKFLYVLCFITIFITSCSKAPKCSSEKVEQEVISTIKKKIALDVETEIKQGLKGEKHYTQFLSILKNKDKYIDDLELKLINFRTNNVNDDIKKCECEAEINLIEKHPINEKELEGKIGKIEEEYRVENFTPSIKYSAQITDEGKIYIVFENSEEIEIIKRNIMMKIAVDIMKKAELLSKNRSNFKIGFNKNRSDNNIEETAEAVSEKEILPGYSYRVYGSPENPVYFYRTPNYSDRKNARFTTSEEVFVESISGNFGFVRFTNTMNQTSKGWIRFEDLYPY